MISETMELSLLGISRIRMLNHYVGFGRNILIHGACYNLVPLSCLGCLLRILLLFWISLHRIQEKNPQEK